MGEMSPWHWLLLAAVALLLFGPKKLPELGKGLAEGIRSFKDGMKDHPPAPTDATKTTESKETKS
jgi:sec-independent protein translocase protein TatA